MDMLSNKYWLIKTKKFAFLAKWGLKKITKNSKLAKLIPKLYLKEDKCNDIWIEDRVTIAIMSD